ncbi:MAG TPA: hypothetical protein VD884_14195 [Ohtaekwangia sp.]|nr:hypothetical protein [Ohtaekwangia sp.]
MKEAVIVVLLLMAINAKGQNIITWNENYKLQLSDFQAGTTQVGNVNIYSLHTASRMEFSFHMSNYEFMFTKNFNSKVSCTFTRNAASLIAPDEEIAASLINFAQFEFDLSELYARKFRKQLYENKGAFSQVTFFEPIYNNLQQEFVTRHAQAAKETDVGRNQTKLTQLHNEVWEEINALSFYCKTCKPPKRNK